MQGVLYRLGEVCYFSTRRNQFVEIVVEIMEGFSSHTNCGHITVLDVAVYDMVLNDYNSV